MLEFKKKENNNNFMFTLLQLKLDKTLKKFNNEYYFTLVENQNIVVGIGRLISFNDHIKYITEIWLNENYIEYEKDFIKYMTKDDSYTYLQYNN